MTEHKHEIVKCVCGKVMLQCKCFDPAKSIRYISNCIHYASTAGPVDEPITLEAIQDTYNEFRNKYPFTPEVIKMSPKRYAETREYFDRKEAEEEAAGVHRFKNDMPLSYLGEIMGVRIMIDPEMGDNEWEIGYRIT